MDGVRRRRRKGILRGGAILLALAVLLVGSGFVLAQGTYTAIFYSSAAPRYSYVTSYDTLEELISKLAENPPPNVLGFDRNTDPINVYSNYAGAAISVDAPASSTDVTVNIPALGYKETFTGDSRTEALDSVETWAATDPDGVIAELDLLPSSLAATGGTGDGGGCFISTLR